MTNPSAAPSPQYIAKTQDERIQDLRDASDLIGAGLNSYKNDKNNFWLVAVSTQLRALLTFNTLSRSKNSVPLLIDLAEENDVTLRLFSMPEKPVDDQNVAGAVYASKTWFPKPVDGLVEYSIRNWMTARAFHNVHTREYIDRNNMVRSIADKQASHYDRNIAQISDSLRTSWVNSTNGLQVFIIDMGYAALYLSQVLLRTIELKKAGSDPAADQQLKGLREQVQRFHYSL